MMNHLILGASDIILHVDFLGNNCDKKLDIVFLPIKDDYRWGQVRQDSN